MCGKLMSIVNESLPENTGSATANFGSADAARDAIDSLIESGDPEIDVRAIMSQIRANIALRQGQPSNIVEPEPTLERLAAEYGIPKRKVLLPDSLLALSDESALEPTLHELNSQWKIQEVPFHSNAPVVGKLIVALRMGWNWVSTRWYVLGLLGQINRFNGTVARAFGELDAEQQFLASKFDRLQATCLELRRELDQLKADKGNQT